MPSEKKPNRIQTKFVIDHKTQEDREEYEKKLDKALKNGGYSTRIEFIKESIRRLIKSQE